MQLHITVRRDTNSPRLWDGRQRSSGPYVCGGQVQLMRRTRHFATLQPHPFIQLNIGGKALRMATQLQRPSLSFLWDHQVHMLIQSCFAGFRFCCSDLEETLRNNSEAGVTCGQSKQPATGRSCVLMHGVLVLD